MCMRCVVKQVKVSLAAGHYFVSSLIDTKLHGLFDLHAAAAHIL